MWFVNGTPVWNNGSDQNERWESPLQKLGDEMVNIYIFLWQLLCHANVCSFISSSFGALERLCFVSWLWPSLFNLLTPSPIFWHGFLHLWIWTHPLLQIGFWAQNNKRMADSADPDETTRYEPSHLDLHCLQRYLYWSAALKGLTSFNCLPID